MMLTWHIFKKDFCRFWPAGLLLAAVFAIEPLIGARLLSHEGEWDLEHFSQSRTYVEMLAVLQLIVTALLVSRLIHEDGFVGTSRPWMTRPISNARLILAKLIGVALLFCLVPALVTLPWWLASGFSFSEASAAFLALATRQGATALLVLPLVLITPNLIRFLLILLVSYLALSAGSFLIEPLGRVPAELSSTVRANRALASWWVAFGTSTLVIVLYTRARLIGRTVGVLVTGSIALLIINLWWTPVTLVFSRQPILEDRAVQRIEAKAQTVRRIPVRHPNVQVYTLTVDLAGIPRDLALTGSSTKEQRWLWPDSEEVINVTSHFGTDSWVFPQAKALLGMEQPSTDETYGVRLRNVASIRPKFMDRFNANPASLQIVGHFRLFRPEVLWEIPLREEATMRRGHQSVRIVQNLLSTSDRKLLVVESSAMPLQWTPRFDVSRSLHHNNIESPILHYLVDRDEGTLLEVNSRTTVSTVNRGLAVAGVQILWRDLEFLSYQSAGLDGFTLDDDVTFASVALEEVATFERPLLFPAAMFRSPD